MKYLIYCRFNMGNDPESPRGKRCMSNYRWWLKRIAILGKYWLPAVRRLKADFDIVMPIAPRAKTDCRETLAKWASDNGITTVLEYDGRFELNEPANWIVNNYDDDLVLINLDSDDLLAPKYFFYLEKASPSEGFTGLLRWGYIYSLKDTRLAEYYSGSSQLHARFFTKESLRSITKMLNYEEKWGMNVTHQRLNKSARKSQYLADDLFMMLDHGSNTTTAWGKKNTQRHIRKEIKGAEKSKILEKFIR